MKFTKKAKIIIGSLIIIIIGFCAYSLLPEPQAKLKLQSTKEEEFTIENIELARQLVSEVNIIKDKELVKKDLKYTEDVYNTKIKRKNATNAIIKASETLSQEDVNEARFLILTLPMSIKGEMIYFNELLDKVQFTIMQNSVDAANIALGSGKTEDIEKAIDLYGEIQNVTFNDGISAWVRDILEPIIQQLIKSS
ncbi:MAG: hypothetical protein RR891_11575 [Clostridium sp.]